MSESHRHLLAPLEAFESAEAGLFVAQMDDLSRRMREDTRDLSAAELAWQPAPGMNTAGMLLAHIAIVEVFWISVLAEGAFLCQQVLGIGGDDDGMPLAAGGQPPAVLAGRGLEFFDDLLARARRNTVALVQPRPQEALVREIQHRRRDRTVTVTGRWILYHLLEHQAGHYGQILMLRHLYRDHVAAGGAARAETA
jgi:uncharacterized damage-inducible protein DinB